MTGNILTSIIISAATFSLIFGCNNRNEGAVSYKDARYVAVGDGDTWESIAQEYATTIEWLGAYNTGIKLKQGEYILVPALNPQKENWCIDWK